MGRSAKLKAGRKQWAPFEEVPSVRMTDGTLVDVAESGFKKVFQNNQYTVFWREHGFNPLFGRCIHLSIKRNDRAPVHDWRDLQRIKNEIVGAEAEAVELYPAESRLVDGANQYHLWCFPGYRFPFGFQERMVRDQHETLLGATQRPLGE